MYENEQAQKWVDAKELHMFLRVVTRFNDWFANKVEQYNFVEGADFYLKLSKNAGRGRPRKEYFLTLNMAKQLCMVENNERGRQLKSCSRPKLCLIDIV
ncbi:hypothetical protein G9U52_01690 [Paenibacillus sp. S3N08]|uniref:AntA/AntB antirepressor domain-containing protein n=1 Tax=Paenibacillus agricola TaxID=2716264 RepID=A0ABX0J3I0_9BACL|nr:hypothetical protein [Paenibacillus agricola]